jgi:hypothetical protein
MPAARIACPNCNATLLGDVFNRPDLTPCPACGQPILIEVFPALFRQAATGRGGEAIMEDGESGCFYHPQKKAVVPCDACGRFLCALCDCELDGQHICPSCLETGKRKGKIKSLQNHRVLYDSIALALAVVPAITCIGACATIITSPAAIYLAIRYWNTPSSLIRRGKTRQVLALIFGSLTLIGWFVYAYIFIFYLPMHHRTR